MKKKHLENKAKLQTLKRHVDSQNDVITWFDHRMNAVEMFGGKKGGKSASELEKDWLIDQLGEDLDQD